MEGSAKKDKGYPITCQADTEGRYSTSVDLPIHTLDTRMGWVVNATP